mmetsp:Transcript_24259/g.59376  ORF Transcript_24259/g.59376 Transcript_24259/m.59376 type:complete len:327 (-) Transcript_24259:74-1054(-)
MPRRSSKRSLEVDYDDDDRSSSKRGGGNFTLSQQVPEASQGVLDEKPSDRNNLEKMDKVAREKAVTSLSRIILFKGLEKEPIDRLKIIKEAGLNSVRASSAIFNEASERLRNIFGMELRRIPKYMEDRKSTPAKCKDRYYLQNIVSDYDGSHSREIHDIHQGSKIENGLVLLINALIFCKGESRSDGSRWVLGRDLYRLLHNVDDALPGEPPAQGSARAKTHSKCSRFQQNSLTPNLDALMDQFIAWDYFIKERATEDNFTAQAVEDGDFIYTMGARSAIEIGRKQIIYFCAEILDVEPDPTMLKEVEEDTMDEEALDEVFMEEAE